MAKKATIAGFESDEMNNASGGQPRSLHVQMSIKSLEEESRELMSDVVRCEVRFAKMDLARGLKIEEIIEGVKERYSERFSKPIIIALHEEVLIEQEA
jgi:hypothetical protein